MPRRKRKRPKLPKVTEQPDTSKVPGWLGRPTLENSHIAWRFSNADMDGPYSCASLSPAQYTEMWSRLRSFETMNVAELRRADSFHAHSLTGLSPMARERLAVRQLDDLDTLYSFRVNATCRIWCMRHVSLLSVLWWDDEHAVYPVAKKHT